MRKTLFALGLMALLAGRVSAQGFGPPDATSLLGFKTVQDELKLSDDQKKALKEANDTFQEAMKKAREDMDFSGIGPASEARVKAIKKVVEKLDDKQAKRLAEIEFQAITAKGNRMKSPNIFANEHIQKALKLTSEQKKTVKDTIADLEKDFKELDEDAKDDFQKRIQNFQKKNKMNTEAYEKVYKSLDDDQKKDFDKAGGEKFEFPRPEFPRRDKDKEKKDDKKEEK